MIRYLIMKKFLQSHKITPFLASFVILCLLSVTLVHAQGSGTSLSGDEVCGRWDPVAQKIVNPCSIADIAKVLKGVLSIVISIGFPLLIVFVAYRFIMAYFAAVQGNRDAYKDAVKKSANAMLGFLFIVALFAGLMFVLLKYVGVKDGPLQLLKLFTDAFIPHAYAEATSTSSSTATTSTGYLPNFLSSNDLYSLLLSIARLVMRFFIYPALIVMWVWTGFAFVLAQGNPDALSKARKWLMAAFISTLVIFMLQGFLIAAQGTVKKILPGFQEVTAPSTATGNGERLGELAPAAGATGSICSLSGGGTGTTGTDGKCYPGRGGTATPGTGAAASFCVGKAPGTVCSVTLANGSTVIGTCSDTGSGRNECTRATNGDECIAVNGIHVFISNGECPAPQPNDSCITAAGAYGRVDASGTNCVAGGARW